MSRRAHNGTTMFGERRGPRDGEGAEGEGRREKELSVAAMKVEVQLWMTAIPNSRGEKGIGAGDTVWLCVSAL